MANRIFRRAFPEYTTGLLTETTGKDISTVTAQVGITQSKTVPPTTWVTGVITHPTTSTIKASLLIDNSVPAGTGYYLWIKPTDNPEVPARCAFPGFDVV